MSRVDQPEFLRRDFHLMIDEFQNFTTEAFTGMLAEARKYRLCLTLSHQYIDQLPLELRRAVFGNVATLISFRVGHNDAEVLENEFGKTFAARQFVDLDAYQVLVKLLENGVAREPFCASTLPPLDTPVGRRRQLVAFSRQRYAVQRQIVETKLDRWLKRMNKLST
jgi:hypothetical protein